MQAAVVHDFQQPPRWGEFPDPQPRAGETLIDVRAAALSNLVRARAAGRHYSNDHAPPLVPGVDGVGRTPNGRRVYFAFPRPPHGSMAEQAAAAHLVELPDSLDDVTAAAAANPVMASWAALTRRARLQPGETVLIHGATGVTGRLAVPIARHLGAGRILVTGRDPSKLARLPADTTMSSENIEKLDEKVDVVLDFLFGSSAQKLLTTLAHQTHRCRYVQIGSIAGDSVQLSAHDLRASGLELMGSGLGSVPLPDLVACIGEAFQVFHTAGLSIEADPVPFSDIETAWTQGGSERLVFTR